MSVFVLAGFACAAPTHLLPAHSEHITPPATDQILPGETTRLQEEVSEQLAKVAADLFGPEIIVRQNQQPTRQDVIAALPAAPAAMLLVLTGAGLVLLVDNRTRVIAACAAAAMLGQAGIRVLPQLVLRSAGPDDLPTPMCRHDAATYGVQGVSANSDATLEYVGLLHRLAGPADPAWRYNSLSPAADQAALSQRLAVAADRLIAATSPSSVRFALASPCDLYRPPVGYALFTSSRSSWDSQMRRIHSPDPPLT